MNYTIEHQDNYTMIYLDGELSIKHLKTISQIFINVFHDITHPSIVLNFKKVTHIDAFGILSILNARQESALKNIHITLEDVSNKVKKTFEITDTHKVLI